MEDGTFYNRSLLNNRVPLKMNSCFLIRNGENKMVFKKENGEDL